MFREILFPAGVAALVAALLLSLAQLVWISPLIAKAEVYEDAAEASSHEEVLPHEHAAGHEEHHHDENAWKPQDGWQRVLFTVAANIVMAFGYALLLGGVYLLGRRPDGALQGFFYGLAGFAIFFVAPGLGLPPELPGTAAAELGARQQWWVLTAAGTAAGLALLFLQPRWWLRGVGALMLVVPHLLGAPHPAIPASLAPESLQQQFRVATAICNAGFWMLLGIFSALTTRKFSSAAEH